MGTPHKNIKVSERAHSGLVVLKKRYKKPISQLIENVVHNCGSWRELDHIFGYRKKVRSRF